MTLYELIKKYAKLRGIGLKEVATRSGLSQNAIYNWKTHRPSDATIIAVAKTLGVSPSDLDVDVVEAEEPRKLDIKAAADDDTTVLSWNGRPIPPEEMEMIRRILDGGEK